MNDYYSILQQPFPFDQFGPGGPGGTPITPPFGPGGPGGAPTTPPFGPGFGRQPSQPGRPFGRPPAFTPQRPIDGREPGAFFVDPGAIRRCRFRYVYIWLTSGQQFWMYLVFVGPNSIAGYRWTGFTWVYFGTDLRNVDTFVCY